MTPFDKAYDDLNDIEQFIKNNRNINLKKVVDAWKSIKSSIVYYKNIPWRANGCSEDYYENTPWKYDTSSICYCKASWKYNNSLCYCKKMYDIDYTVYFLVTEGIIYYFLKNQYNNAVCLFNSWYSNNNSTIIEELLQYKINLNDQESHFIHHALVPEFISIILQYKPHLKPITFSCIKKYISDCHYEYTVMMRENEELCKLHNVYFPKYLKKIKRYDFLIALYNLFKPVDGDYVLRGLIGDFMIELIYID